MKFLNKVLKVHKRLSLLLAALVFTFIANNHSYAAFTISVTPYDGSFDLRFEKIDQIGQQDAEKEVTIAVNTDIGKRYQVIQALLSPLTNTEGEVLPADAVTVYTLRGSNTRGTLALDSEVPLGAGRTIIYTSDVLGNNDSFVLVYRLRHYLISQSGLYKGRLNFFLEPIDSSQAPAMAKLDVEIDIELPGEVKVTTSTGSRTITLDSSTGEAYAGEVTISIQGQGQGQYRILQVVEPLISQQGEELKDGLYLLTRDGKKGILAYPSKAKLKQGQTLLYTSDARGLDDEITISYGIEENLKSAIYRGTISYYLQKAGYFQEGELIDSLGLEVEISPIFEINITLADGGRQIEFKDVKEGRPQETEVLIEVNTNLGMPYQVNQNVSSLLTNKEGRTIDKEHFKFTTKAVESKDSSSLKGALKHPSESPVELGETIMFISNYTGSPDKFMVVYKLDVPRDQRGGDYTTGISYSLAQIGVQ